MKEDNVTGFAIDRNMMDAWLIQIFGGTWSEINQWKEKAQKWDEYACHGHLGFAEMEEKAKSYDTLVKYLATLVNKELLSNSR